METMRERKVCAKALRYNGPFHAEHKADESFLVLDTFVKNRNRTINNKAQTLNLG